MREMLEFSEQYHPSYPPPDPPHSGEEEHESDLMLWDSYLRDVMQFNTNEVDDALSKYNDNWGMCKRCKLCENRRKIVHWRGYLPADVAFLGEAPGQTEDFFGIPFVGESGATLDDIVESIEKEYNSDLIYCVINVVGCIPRTENGTRVPEEEELSKCRKRMIELLQIAQPKLIVAVGQTANDQLASRDFAPEELWLNEVDRATILHPSSILRRPVHQQTGLLRQQISTIVNALEPYVAP